MGTHAKEEKKETPAKKLGRPKVSPIAAVPSNIRVNSENPMSVCLQFMDGSEIKLNATEIATSSDRLHISIKRGIVVRKITVPLSRIALFYKDEIPSLMAAQPVSRETVLPAQGLAAVPIEGDIPRDASNPTPAELKQRMRAMQKSIKRRGSDFYRIQDGDESAVERADPKITVSLKDAI